MLPIHVPDAVAVCARLGLRAVVLSPGSRCAPLTLCFVRHPDIDTYTISDERSAAFVALGMAQATGRPVALVCTSGSAAYNYAPAVAEAFFRQVPLLILTADRPPEWINQHDGQTIFQRGLYNEHVKKSFELPTDSGHADARWHAQRLVSEAMNLCVQAPAGPVHINVPLREPLYPTEANVPDWQAHPVKAIQYATPIYSVPGAVGVKWQQQLAQYPRILIIAGQQPTVPGLAALLERFAAQYKAVVVADVLGNLHGMQGAVRLHDAWLDAQNADMGAALAPDLVISFGQSVIAKNLKLFIRAHKPKAHWHLQTAGLAADTFQALTHVLPFETADFFEAMLQAPAANAAQPAAWQTAWQDTEARAVARQRAFLAPAKLAFGEFATIAAVMRALPANSQLHLANSMAVRYANHCALWPAQAGVQVWANRGTSGIDGSTSTVVGAALAQPDCLHVLLTGDLAFFYDRNGLWNNYVPENLRIVVLNNHSGGIFRLIPGPRQQPELEKYFETEQPLSAVHAAKEYGLTYFSAGNTESLNKLLPEFLSTNTGAALLETESSSPDNFSVFSLFKSEIKGAYGAEE